MRRVDVAGAGRTMLSARRRGETTAEAESPPHWAVKGVANHGESVTAVVLRSHIGGATARLPLAVFEDPLADLLGFGLDLLHFLSHASTGGLVAANRLVQVVLDLGHHRFKLSYSGNAIMASKEIAEGGKLYLPCR